MKPLTALTSRCKPSTYYALILLHLFFLISACSQTPIMEQLSSPDWKIAGKIGVKKSLLNGGSATFTWSQENENYIIHLFNPLGQPQLTLKGNQSIATASTSGGEYYQGDTPEQLMQQIAGWSFPVNNVRQWLQGKTAGNETLLNYNELHQLQSFSTQMWQVNLDKYKPVGDNNFPHRLKLRNENMKITLIIKQHNAKIF